MNKERLVYAAASGIAALSLSLAPVLAAEASNDTTGAQSNNEAEVEIKNDVDILQDNKLFKQDNYHFTFF